MRSEKEIRELLSEYKEMCKEANKDYTKSRIVERGSLYLFWDDEYDSHKKIMNVFAWVLEGEPRYSVLELKKIFSFLCDSKPNDPKLSSDATAWVHMHDWDTPNFLDFLKDSKKVQEILK